MLWRWLVIGLVIVWGSGAKVTNSEDVDLTIVDVKKLSTRIHGTDLLLLENAYRDQGSYRFEDFFWTGSGDGPEDESNWDSEDNPSTIYKTKTVVTTVFIESPNSANDETSKANTTKCSLDCDVSPRVPDGEIRPSPTYTNYTDLDGSEDDFFDADRQFWLLTVLKSNGKDPVILDLKNSLAKLYKTAFQRQQEKHLGIANGRSKRQTKDKPVNVYIHKVNRTKSNGEQKIEVLYHVSLDGKPVSAVTAANDMLLVSDEEVRKELGYPFVIKAEPYLKPSEPQGLSSAKNTWLFIGISIVAFLVFLLILAFILGCTKKKKRVGTPTSVGIENRQHIFERGATHDNKGGQGDSPTYIKYTNDNSTLLRNTAMVGRPESSISSVSTSSGSLDISPLMAMKKHRRTPPKKPPRPKAALNRTVPMEIKKFPLEVFDSDSSRKDSPDPEFGGNFEPGVVSPKSYLSMPSVKSFPRGNIPEPLNKVLEPVSVHHLDIPEDDFREHEYDDRSEIYKKFGLTRHGSLGAVEDPGVIGPIVWSMHREKILHGVSVDEGINDINTSTNLTKMRKRFHDLLDDTFSLFGSRRTSPVENKKFDRHSRAATEVKSHSAVNRSADDLKAPPPKPRPRTTDPRKVDQPPTGPKGAWSSTAPSPLIRPLSAGIINPYPRVNVDHVLAEGKFTPNDPALTLIATIKSEIERISLPGSTTQLNQ